MVGGRRFPMTQALRAVLAPWRRRPAGSPAVLGEIDAWVRVGGAVVVGFVVVFLFGFGFVPISGAVVAGGQITVEGNSKSVQHNDGGVVAEIRVRDGATVRAGDVLLRLDDTQWSATLGVAENQLIGQLSRHARLVAERRGLPDVVFPDEVLRRAAASPEIAGMLDSERRVFAERRRTFVGQREQLVERVRQIEAEIAGYEAEQVAAAAQLDVSARELAALEPLFKRGLVSMTRFNDMRRSVQNLEGRTGGLSADIARARGRLAEARLAVRQVEIEFQNKVEEDSRAALELINGHEEQVRFARDRVARAVIRAPASGVVYGSTVHTVGGVVKSSDVLMQIVPQSSDLIVQAVIEPAMVDQVRIGQPAFVQFDAFDRRLVSTLEGTVVYLAPDLETSKDGTRSFYRARVRLERDEEAAASWQALLPGMRAQVFIRTSDRTILSYLFRPLADQINLAFRER